MRLLATLFSIGFCLIFLCSCQIGNPDYRYIYENKCLLTGRTEVEEFVNYMYITIDASGTILPVPYEDNYTKYEYKCMDGSLQWSEVRYDIAGEGQHPLKGDRIRG